MPPNTHLPSHGPFFFQMLVSPKKESSHPTSIHAGYATLMVFADSGELARERAGKFLSKEGWEITEMKRMQLLTATDIAQLHTDLKNIYKTATNMGIGCHIDSW